MFLQITMRGAEQPGKINWTRPFLPPLEPISALASRQTFIEIADSPMVDEEAALAELIELTGSLPLAVVLMANVASFEGYLGALSRWKTENIALLSDGFDRRSNLEKSISLSLTSPRIKSNPHTLDLLSILSLLPDGVSEDELTASQVPIPNIPQCRSVLLQTTLAFLAGGRMKVLTPVRDYIRNAHPLSAAITRPLWSHFRGLLNMYRFYSSLSPRDLFPQVSSHLGNIQSLFLEVLTTEGFAQPDMGYAILALNDLSQIMLKGENILLEHLPAIIDSSHDQGLRWKYARHCIKNHSASPEDVSSLMNQGIQYFIQAKDYEGQGRPSLHAEVQYLSREHSRSIYYPCNVLRESWRSSPKYGSQSTGDGAGRQNRSTVQYPDTRCERGDGFGTR
jgi:hypothetical protein